MNVSSVSPLRCEMTDRYPAARAMINAPIFAFGQTALVQLKKAADLPMVEVLLEFGADPNQRGFNDWTALHFAQLYPARVASITSVTGAGFLLNDEASRKESEEIHKRVQAVTKKASEEPTREKVRERLEWLMWDKRLCSVYKCRRSRLRVGWRSGILRR